jgi:hypothetical protein
MDAAKMNSPFIFTRSFPFATSGSQNELYGVTNTLTSIHAAFASPARLIC